MSIHWVVHMKLMILYINCNWKVQNYYFLKVYYSVCCGHCSDTTFRTKTPIPQLLNPSLGIAFGWRGLPLSSLHPLPGRRLHQMTDCCEGTKVWLLCLWKAVPASELPIGLAKASVTTVITHSSNSSPAQVSSQMSILESLPTNLQANLHLRAFFLGNTT